MVDVATLSYRVDTGSVAAGTQALEEHARAARQTGTAARSAGQAMDEEARSARNLGAAVTPATSGAAGLAVGVNGVATSSRNAQAGLQNLSFQMQDVTQGVLAGQSAMQLATQQGFQFAYAMQQAGGGIRSVITGLRGLVSVQNLVVIGFIAAIGAIGQVFAAARRGGADAEAVTDNLTESVDRLREVYGEAADEVGRLTEAERMNRLFTATFDLANEAERYARALAGIPLLMEDQLRFRAGREGAGVAEGIQLIGEFRDAIREGDADVDQFVTDFERLATTTADNAGLFDFVVWLRDVTSEAREAGANVEQLEALIAQLEGRATPEQQRDLLGITTDRERLLGEFDDLLDQIGARAQSGGREIGAALALQITTQLTALREEAQPAIQSVFDGLRNMFGSVIPVDEYSTAFIELLRSIGDLARAADGTTGNILELREAVGTFALLHQEDAQVQALALHFLALSEPLTELEIGMQAGVEALKAYGAQADETKPPLDALGQAMEELKATIADPPDNKAAIQSLYELAIAAATTAEQVKLAAQTYAAAMGAFAEENPGPSPIEFGKAVPFKLSEAAGAGGGGGPSFDFERQLDGIRRQTQALQIQQATFGMSAIAAETYRLEQEAINAATLAGIELSPDQIDALHAVVEEYRVAAEELEALRKQQEMLTEAQQRFERLTMDFLSSFVQALEDGKTGVEALGEAFRSLGQQLIQMALQMLVYQILGPLFGTTMGMGGFGGGNLRTAIGAFTLHEGGQVGAPGTPARSVSGINWDAVPRFHGGLRPGEFPAILEAGETVTPRGGSSGSTVQIVVDVRGARGNAEIEDMVQKGVAAGMEQTLRQVPGIAVRSVGNAYSRSSRYLK